MDSLNKLLGSIAELRKDAEKAIDETLTPDVLAAMTPEQMEIVNGSAAIFDTQGKSMKKQAEEMNNLIRKNAAFNS